MKIFNITGAFGGLMLLTACVTINIYFPAAQAEAAAGRIVDDILGEQPPAGDKGSMLLPSSADDASLAQNLLDFLIPAAQAQAAPDFNVNTPQIRKLQASMKQRNNSLKPYYDSGAVGFTTDARVAIRDASKISLKQKNKVKQLLAAENRDRDALYRAIAEANGQPKWEGQIRSTFARTWVQKAARGWWYQSDGGWKQK